MTPAKPEVAALAAGLTEAAVITRIVELSEAIAWQAGVGGMETAGSIVSYLHEHPEDLPKLMDGTLSVIDWPMGWHMHGCLSWHGQDGKIYRPETVRRTQMIREMEKSAQPPSLPEGD